MMICQSDKFEKETETGFSTADERKYTSGEQSLHIDKRQHKRIIFTTNHLRGVDSRNFGAESDIGFAVKAKNATSINMLR